MEISLIDGAQTGFHSKNDLLLIVINHSKRKIINCYSLSKLQSLEDSSNRTRFKFSDDMVFGVDLLPLKSKKIKNNHYDNTLLLEVSFLLELGAPIE